MTNEIKKNDFKFKIINKAKQTKTINIFQIVISIFIIYLF